MKIETILDAMLIANLPFQVTPKRARQYRAFRARILKMDAEKDARIERILAQLDAHKLSNEFALEEKDARIAELKAEIKDLNSNHMIDAPEASCYLRREHRS